MQTFFVGLLNESGARSRSLKEGEDELGNLKS